MQGFQFSPARLLLLLKQLILQKNITWPWSVQPEGIEWKYLRNNVWQPHIKPPELDIESFFAFFTKESPYHRLPQPWYGDSFIYFNNITSFSSIPIHILFPEICFWYCCHCSFVTSTRILASSFVDTIKIYENTSSITLSTLHGNTFFVVPSASGSTGCIKWLRTPTLLASSFPVVSH